MVTSNPDVNSNSITAKRTVLADIPFIEKLIGSTELNIYPQSSLKIGRVIETSIFSVTLYKDEEIVGFGAFDIPKTFENILEENKLERDRYTTLTCLGLTVLILNRKEDSSALIDVLFTTVYKSVSFLYFVLILWTDKRLADIGTEISKTLTVVNRDEFVPILYVRDAVVEDNDDINVIYDNESEQLKEYYGTFFFSELVEATNLSNKVLVADVNDTAVGCIAITSQIGFDRIRKTHQIDRFTGLSPQNSIAIQLYILEKQRHDRGIDMIRGAFEALPNAEWIIITLPRQIQYFSLIDLFTRVIPKGAVVENEVYVLHRVILSNTAQIRRSVLEDVPFLTQIDHELGGQAENALDEKNHKNEHFVFTMTLADVIIGGIVLQEEEDINKIRTAFDIEQFIYFEEQKASEHYRIISCIVIPGYQGLTRFTLSEVCRQLNAVTLYQRVTNETELRSSISKELINILPREKIYYAEDLLGINMPDSSCFLDADFGLLIFSKKHTFESRIQLSHAIVVVGASDAGVSAVTKLAMTPHLILNNLTFVSEIFHDDYLDGELCTEKKLINSFEKPNDGLCVSVNRCRATMAGINVQEKKLILSTGKWLPYDILLLCVGKQVKGVYGNPPGFDEKQCATLLRNLKENPDTKLFIKGTTLGALSLIERIMQNNIGPNRLIYGMDENISALFGHGKEKGEDIGEIILDNLKNAGVDVIEDIDTVELITYDNGELDYIKVNEAHEYECHIYLDVSESKVSNKVFKVLSDACLVYDGALVIQPNFSTSNQYVMAAGTMTKYPRRLYGDNWSHDKYNLKDVGVSAADEILRRIQQINVSNHLSIPTFDSPIINSCVLPGGKRYLYLRTPPKDALSDGNKARIARWLLTSKDAVVSKIHINAFGHIDQMMFLSNEELPIENIIRLFGFHESYINQLVSRYDEELIPCLLDHLRQPEIQAVNHDRFKLLVKEFDDAIRLSIDDIDPHTEQALEEKYTKQIESRLLGFLKHNQPLLSMYAEPIKH